MTILRFFTRAIFLLSLTSIAVLVATLTISGAFRPVRFFVAGPSDFSLSPVYAVFESGELYQLARTEERITDLQVGQDRMSWIDEDRTLIQWQNGQQQVMGTSFREGDNKTWWSNEDRFAWVQPQEANPDLKDIAVWNGSETMILARDAGELTHPYWLLDHRLWWFERMPRATNWNIMQWDGQEVTLVAETESTFYPSDIQFMSCGAFWVKQDSTLDPLQVWNGSMASITMDAEAPIQFVSSWDCQTFLFSTLYPWEARSENFLWDGEQLQRTPFEAINFLEPDTFFAAAPPVDDASDWTLHHLDHDGQSLQSIPIPQARLITQPQFSAIPLDADTLIVTVTNTSRIGDLYRWELAENQLYPITGEYRVREAYVSFSYQRLDLETNPKLVWCGGPADEIANTIYQWEARTNQVTVVQTDAVCSISVMSDGSLIGLTTRDGSEPPVFFRWDGQTSHLFPRNDQIGISTFIYSDWFILK